MSEKERKLLDETARVVEIAMSKGAHTAVAAMQEKSEFQVEVRKSEIENLSEADFRSVSLTVSKNGRRATVSSCDLSAESIEALTEQALGMCKYTDEDPFYSLPEQALLATEDMDLDLYDPNVEALEVSERIKSALALEEALLAQDPRLKAEGTSLSTVYGTTVLANSLGFCQSRKTSLIYLSASAFAEDEVGEGELNTGRKQTASWSTRARHVSDLAPLDEVAQITANRVLRKLGGRKPPSGMYPVYLEPSMARALWGSLLSAISGTQVYRHESYLGEMSGKMIASKNLTIRDEPLLKRGLASRHYDGEGVACKPSLLVNEGRLETFLLSTYSAKKLGLRSTGHAGGSSNLIIEPGDKSEADMLREMGTGVWITSLLGQGVNINTGDYSRGAFGLWVENGEVQYPVMEFTINSNMAQMFGNIVAVGNNVHHSSTIQTPGIVIGEMAVSGG